MSAQVTMQLNAPNVAGDWATRPAGAARNGTGEIGGGDASTDVAVVLFDLRGAVESLRRGAHSPNIADSRTEVAELSYGTPALYCGMRFAVDFA